MQLGLPEITLPPTWKCHSRRLSAGHYCLSALAKWYIHSSVCFLNPSYLHHSLSPLSLPFVAGPFPPLTHSLIMKFFSLVAASLAFVAVGASADPSVDALPALSRHPLSMQRRNAMMAKKMVVARRSNSASKKACRARTSNAASGHKSHSRKHHHSHTKSSTSTSSSSAPSSQTSGSQSNAGGSSGSKATDNSGSSSASSGNDSSTKSSSTPSSTSSSSTSTSTPSSGSGAGLLGLSFGSCGSSGATSDYPNGSQDFLNCGVTSGGWTPPNVKLSQLEIISSTDAASSSVFAPCKNILWAFQAAEKTYNIPATVLMSFAMQESTCNPNATGGNGEQGLMQITPDKCGGAPNGNCKDVGFNVNTGAQYFRTVLDQYGGNVLQAIGQYNGWQKGLTVASATAAKAQGHCYAQNNLDYLFQMLNGWFLGKDNAESLGKYHNLASC